MSQEAIPPLGGYSEAALDQAFAELTREVEASAQSLSHAEAVEQFRLQWLGRKQGRLKSISDAWLKSAPVEAKKLIGQRFNQLKAQIEARLDSAAGAGSQALSTPKPSTSRYPGRTAPSEPSIRSSRPCTRWSPSSSAWATPPASAPRSKP